MDCEEGRVTVRGKCFCKDAKPNAISNLLTYMLGEADILGQAGG